MAENLNAYNEKRRFDKTNEPKGQTPKRKSGNLSFVVQHHVASRDHFDFRLEWDGVLKSWAVPKGPSYNTRDKRLAVQVEDHPFDYRNFEGTIPKGQYGGGTVMVWDEGTWVPTVDAAEGLQNGQLKFTLQGERLKGDWALVRMKPKPGEDNDNWLLIKEKDALVDSYDVKQFTTSVKTGRSMAEIGQGKKTANARFTIKDFNITSPDKLLFTSPDITKEDVAKYYIRVAKRMLPYLENRLISTVRCPGGINGACFFKKHPSGETDGVVSIPVPTKDGKKEDYFFVVDIYGLLHEVQMNTLEFHTWGSRAETLEKPDMMVFDLDPDEGLGLDQIRQGVCDLKSLLDELSLVSYLKTSGGKGYHVVVPFVPAASWEHFHGFAKNIAKTMEAQWPDRYTSNVRKAKRSNRIFIDWIRNGRGATSVAPYSLRAREGAPVSMPISWKELDTVEPQSIKMEDAITRLRRKDPWAGFFDNDQQINTKA